MLERKSTDSRSSYGQPIIALDPPCDSGGQAIFSQGDKADAIFYIQRVISNVQDRREKTFLIHRHDDVVRLENNVGVSARF